MVRAVIWLPGLSVAIGAAVATAHGLYEVAHAARVPTVIAWLYPLITDGLALVAYTATARLSGSAARYAWSVVVLAAGLSGLAQAAYLASGSAVDASPGLRFGVGAWPAIAAAIVAHLLYLLATHDRPPAATAAPTPTPGTGVQPQPFTPAPVQSFTPAPVQPFTPAPVQPFTPAPVQSVTARPVQAAASRGVQLPAEALRPVAQPAPASTPTEQHDRRPGGSPAKERARAAATRHAHRHGHLPTVSELETAAEVSRGTAAAALKHLRDHPAPPQVATPDTGHPAHTDAPTLEDTARP